MSATVSTLEGPASTRGAGSVTGSFGTQANGSKRSGAAQRIWGEKYFACRLSQVRPCETMRRLEIAGATMEDGARLREQAEPVGSSHPPQGPPNRDKQDGESNCGGKAGTGPA